MTIDNFSRTEKAKKACHLARDDTQFSDSEFDSSRSDTIIVNMHIGLSQQNDKLVFFEMFWKPWNYSVGEPFI